MEIIKPRTLSGFMELLPEKQLKFDRMAEVLRKTYASYGFAPLDTSPVRAVAITMVPPYPNRKDQARKSTQNKGEFPCLVHCL